MTLGQALIAELDARGVRYCHWKSNDKLHEALHARTDLDLLVHRLDAATVESALWSLGFKRFPATSVRSYPSIDDYLGLDQASGDLVHVHLHYDLVVGENHLKGHRLDWTERVLERRVWDEENETWVTDPHDELMLLLVRSALKLRFRDRFLSIVKKRRRSGASVEFEWLCARVTHDRVVAEMKEYFGEAAAVAASRLLERGFSDQRLRQLRRAIVARLALSRRFTRGAGAVRRFGREVVWLFAGVSRRLRKSFVLSSRRCVTGGLLVAVIGVDGSGKSTVIAQVTKWLSKKADVMRVYMGSGQGASSLLRMPLVIARRVLRPGKRGGGSGAPGAGRKGFAVMLWALTLAREKRNKLYKAWRARNNGVIVICDRYPQNAVLGFNDGPLLSHAGSRSLSLARWERIPYEMAQQKSPDLLIRLHVDPEIAYKRKQDMPVGEIEARQNALMGIDFGAGRTVDIDANQPLDEVILQVKRAVWECL